jgi:S-adenosylmethionine/arginine decarboxylase-like enzyme
MYDEGRQILKEYYHVLGIKRDKSRKQEQVKARAAMMTAMRQNELTTTSIAKLFDSDHSTVVHHTRKHEANMATWPGYEKNYIAAVRLCGETLKYKAWQSKLHSVKASIARLQSMQRKLEETIQSKQLTNV